MAGGSEVAQKNCAKCGGRIEPGKRTCIFGHIQIGGGMRPGGSGAKPAAKPAPHPAAAAPAGAPVADSRPAVPRPAPVAEMPADTAPRTGVAQAGPGETPPPRAPREPRASGGPLPGPEGAPPDEPPVPAGPASDSLGREKRLLMEKAAEIRQQKEDLERAKAAYDQEIQMLHARSHDLEEREARLERESEEVRRLKENSDTKSRVEEERLRSRENSVREQEQALARSVLRFEERQSELAERERLLKSQADRIKADVDGIEKDRGRVKEEVEKVRSLWDTFQNAIAEIKRKADQLAQLESELGRTRADFVSLEARLKEKEVEVAELKMKLHMAQGQIERAGSRAAAEGGVVDAPGVEMQLPKPEPGQSYLIVTDDAGPFYTTYAALLEAGSDGVMVVITHPDKMRKKYNIARGRAMWLTTDRGSGSVHPARLDYELTRDLTRFFKEKPGAVVLLDGIRTLVQANGFDKVANFVKRLCDLAATQNGIVLVPVQPGSFEAQEMTVLKEAFDFVAEPPATPGR